MAGFLLSKTRRPSGVRIACRPRKLSRRTCSIEWIHIAARAGKQRRRPGGASTEDLAPGVRSADMVLSRQKILCRKVTFRRVWSIVACRQSRRRPWPRRWWQSPSPGRLARRTQVCLTWWSMFPGSHDGFTFATPDGCCDSWHKCLSGNLSMVASRKQEMALAIKTEWIFAGLGTMERWQDLTRD